MDARDLERLGHCGQVTLKSDQVPAIVDLLKEIANLRGARGTLSEHSPVADSQSNGFIERGIRSVEEMTRVILFDLSSRVGSPISVHSPVFPWIVEHATDILNKCHVASDGNSAYERLKRRQHRDLAIRCSGDVQSCWEGSRRSHDGEVAFGYVTGKTFPYREHIVARKGDGLVIRSRAVKAMPEETTLEDLNAIKGSPWATAGVSRDVLPDVPRPILSRDEPPFVPVVERPVPRNKKISQDILRKFGYTSGCEKCRKLSRNEHSHPGLTQPPHQDRGSKHYRFFVL